MKHVILRFLLLFIVFLPWPSLEAAGGNEAAWEAAFMRYSLQVKRDTELVAELQQGFQHYCDNVITKAENAENQARLYYYSMLQNDRYEALKITLFGEKITLINSEFNALRAAFFRTSARVAENMQRYDSLIKEQQNFLPGLKAGKGLKLIEDNIAQTEKFREIFAQWKSSEDRVNATLDRVQKNLITLSADSDARQTQVISSIFFNNESNFLETLPFGWLYIRYWLEDSSNSLLTQSTLLRNVSWTFFAWTAFFFITGLTLWMFFYHRYLKIILEHRLPEVFARRNQFRFSILMISLCLSILLGTYLVEEVDMNIIRQFSIGFLLLFTMKLALSLRMGKELQKNVQALYRVIELCYFLCLLLSANVISYNPLIILSTVIAFLAFCAVAIRVYHGDFPLLPERIFAICTLINYLSATVLGFFGYAYVSLTLMLSWFVLVALMQGLLGISHFARELATVDSRHPMIHRVIDKLLLPLGWITLVIYMVQWLSYTFHVEQKLSELLNMEIVRQNVVKFDIRTLFTVILFGILLYFIISSIKLVLRTYCSEYMEFGILPSIMILGTYVAWMCYTILTLFMLNVDYSGVLVILGGMSMGLGFGLKDMVENFLAGLILLVGQEVRPGDVVENCDTGVIGKIKQISVRATVVESFDGAILTYPNGQMLGKDFKNWTSNNTMRRTSLTIGVAYGSDLRRVHEIIMGVLRKTPGVFSRPEPEVLLTNFNSSSIDFEVRFWANVLRSINLRSELQYGLYRAFDENGISIPFPQLDVHFPDAAKPAGAAPVTADSQTTAPTESND